MGFKMKCTQCGCEDLEEVDFPYEATLKMTECGIRGEATFYDLEDDVYTSTYICTRCGHFEFFNPELAKIILEDRQKISELQSRIGKLNDQISENENESHRIDEEIVLILKQLEDLDITIRQSNELKEKQNELEQKKAELNRAKNVMLEKRKLLYKDLKEFED